MTVTNQPGGTAPGNPTPPPRLREGAEAFHGRHARRDKDEDGLLSRDEAALDGPDFQRADRNKDGKLSRREHSRLLLEKNSFRALDTDGSGDLSSGELARLERITDTAYDADADGRVTREEFATARRTELNASRMAHREEEFEALSGKAKARWVKQADADADGELSLEEYIAGRQAENARRHQQRADALMRAAGAEDGELGVSSAKGRRYASYDANGDGVVDRTEFGAGYEQDRVANWQARLLDARQEDAALRERLGVDAQGELQSVAGAEIDFHANRNDWFICQYGGQSNTREDTTGYDNANCGPTSLTMVARAFGVLDLKPSEVDAAIEDTRRKMGVVVSDTEGSSYPNIAIGARKYGLDADVKFGTSAQKVAEELARGRLVIANVRPSYLFPNSTSGHYTVVTRVEGGKVYMNDPANKNGPMAITVAAFNRAVAQKGSYAMVSIGRREDA